MDNTVMRLTVLGSRGSIPVSGPQYRIFGGSTSCYMVEAGGETIFLDAGTGLLNAPAVFPRPPVILLSHLHLDHVLGLGMYPRLNMRGAVTGLMLEAPSAQQAFDRVSELFRPPYWPLRLTEYPGRLETTPLAPRFQIGAVEVEAMAGNHPDGGLVFRLGYGGKQLVYATDYEPEAESFARLISFCRGADLVLYDAQYTEEEYLSKRGFGHSTAVQGQKLLRGSGAKELLLIHHNPFAADRELLIRERIFLHRNIRYAREGEVFEL